MVLVTTRLLRSVVGLRDTRVKDIRAFLERLDIGEGSGSGEFYVS